MAEAMIDFQKSSQLQSQSRLKQEWEKDMETLLNTFTEETEKQEDQNFFQDDNDVRKKKKENGRIKLYQHKSQVKKFINNCFLQKV